MLKRFKKSKKNEPVPTINKKKDTGKVSKRKHVRMKQRKANFPILSLLEIPKTVPITIQSELSEFVREGKGAVREASGGFTVIALVYDQLEKSGLKDAPDDDFGQFSLGLRGDTIRSATRIEDLEQGNIIFIPNEDTIHALSEYNALIEAGITFNWAIYPSNPETIDETITEITDKTVTVNDLLGILQSPEYMDAIILNGFEADETEETETEDAIEETIVDETETDDVIEETIVDETETEDVIEETVVDENSREDTPFEDEPVEEFIEYQIPEVPFEEDIPEVSFEEDVSEMLFEEDVSEMLFEEETDMVDENNETGMAGQEKEMREVIEPEDFTNELMELSNKKIEDPEIHFIVRAEDFNLLFGARKPYQFKLTTSELLLNTLLNEKRQQYNSEMARLNENNMQQLAQAYTSRMDDAVSKARELLDDYSTETEAGKERLAIESAYNTTNARLDIILDEQNQKKTENYEKEREEHAEEVKLQAIREYNTINKDKLDRMLNDTKEEILSDSRLNRNVGLKKLHIKRQQTANRFLDDTHRQVIQDLQNVYQMMIEDEELIRKEMEGEITDYLHKHFKDDTMRNEALAEKLRQETEGSRVRKEMEERLQDNQKFIENMQAQADANVESLQSEHRAFIEHMQQEYNREMEMKSQLLAERETALKEKGIESKQQYDEQRKDSQELLKEAEKQYENKLGLLNQAMDSQSKIIETFRTKTDKRLIGVILGGLTLVTALVMVFLFLFTQQYTSLVTDAAKPSEIKLTMDSPLLNGESKTASDDVIDAYVVTSTNKKESSVIIGYKEKYKVGDKVKIIGSMSGGSVSGLLTVKSVKDKTVTLESANHIEYKFIATK